MKLFVFIVAFSIVPLVFADDVVWESDLSGSPVPRRGLQEGTQVPKVYVIKGNEEQPENQQSNGKVHLGDHTQGPWVWLLSALGVCITTAGVVVAYRNVQPAREVQSLPLSIGEWTIHHLPGQGVHISCKVTNRGTTPATIGASAIGYRMAGKGLLHPHRRTAKTIGPLTVEAQACEMLIVRLLPRSDMWKLLHSGWVKLFVSASVTYQGKWRRKTRIESRMAYDSETGTFLTVGPYSVKQ